MVEKRVYRWIGLSVLGFTLFSCQSGEEPIQPELTTLTESVYASLIIQPDELYNVHAAVGGILKEVMVTEGDTVQRQTALMQISNTSPELNLRNAKLALELAKRNYEGSANVLNELADETAIAQLRMQNDSVNFVKQRNLWKKNIGTQNAYETRELAYLSSKSNYKLLVNRLDRTEQDLSTRWQEAQNNYRNAQNTEEDYTLYSRIDGRVYKLLKEAGEMVSLQESVAIIGSARNFIIEMEIDEVDITRVENGQRIVIALDAYPERTFNAFVSRIYPGKNMATQTFTVEASFVEAPEKLYSGLSGEANIITQMKSNALVIPRTYVSNNHEVKTDEGMVQVEIGLQSLSKVEVLSGIDSTTHLYLIKK